LCINPGVSLSTDELKRVALFSDLSEKELRNLAAEMRERTFAPGQTVTVEGESGVGFFVIESGVAEVSVRGDVRATLGPGDSFGEIALLTDLPRTATIVATTELRCHGLTQWQFRPLVEGDAAMAWRVIQALAKMIAQA
jgi:CRP/FNR family cyclic AMP-dependent transcriptional regulator